MKIDMCEQLSPEWWAIKVGKISGTRFGQVISNRKNRLVYELMNEILSGECEQDDFVSDDMQYGIDNQSVALSLYTKATGIKTVSVGAILSEQNDIHMASPDGLSECGEIVQEVKCNQGGSIHIQRIFEGIESNYLPQCVNYFAVSPEVKEVHFVSYCGYRTERPIHIVKLYRHDYMEMITDGICGIVKIQEKLNKLLDAYRF